MFASKKMTLPTAHSYILKELKNNINLINEDFLKPSTLIKHLSKIETTLSKDIENLDTEDFSKNIDKNEKLEISKILQKIEVLEKSANQKIAWAKEFSKFLNRQCDSK